MNSPDVSKLIAKVLAGSWRPLAAPLEVAEHDLLTVTPWLLQSGAGSLAWRRVAASSLFTSDAGRQLQQAYRLHTLQALAHKRDIKRVLTLLRKHGIEPILVKGWSVARLYPEPGLRPYGDIDLCVHPGDFARTKTLLTDAEGKSSDVDLHRGFRMFDHQSWEEMKSRSLLPDIDGLYVRTLSAEDHLRLICFHFLREGAWRPLWLCDIAVAVETRPERFDWELFLGRKERSRQWFACAILLAEHLVEASLDGVPSLVTSRKLPRWLVPSVLRQWNAPSMPLRHRAPLSRQSHVLMKTVRGFGAHWPSPIEGTIGVRGPFNEMPRLPFQLGQCCVRVAKYLASA
jgi:hypothetical protein